MALGRGPEDGHLHPLEIHDVTAIGRCYTDLLRAQM